MSKWRVPVRDLCIAFRVAARSQDHAQALLDTEAKRPKLFIAADPIARMVVADLKQFGRIWRTDTRVESESSVLFEYDVQLKAGRGFALVKADSVAVAAESLASLFKGSYVIYAHDSADPSLPASHIISLTGGIIDYARAVEVR